MHPLAFMYLSLSIEKRFLMCLSTTGIIVITVVVLAQHPILEAAELVEQPPAPRDSHVRRLARRVPVVFTGLLLLGPIQPTAEFLYLPFVLLLELLDLPFVLLSKLFEGLFLGPSVVLSKVFEAVLEIPLVLLSKPLEAVLELPLVLLGKLIEAPL